VIFRQEPSSFSVALPKASPLCLTFLIVHRVDIFFYYSLSLFKTLLEILVEDAVAEDQSGES
jgi:hypothetical protein